MIATDIAVCDTPGVFNVGDVVRKMRKAKGWSQEELGQRAGGINKETIYRIELGGNPRLDTLFKIAEALGVSPERLFPQLAQFETGGDIAPQEEAELTDDDVSEGYKRNDIPVIAEGDASPEPNLFWDGEGLRSDVEDRISRPFDVRDPRAYGVRVRGDSMVPRYNPGDTLVISPNSTVDDGDEAYVTLLSGERLLKIARRAGEGWILESYNPAHPARFVGRAEIGTIHRILWIRPKRRSKSERQAV